MEERLKLSRDSTTEVDATQYRRCVGSLRYLTHTRPDLAFSVGYVSRFMQRPTTEHQQAVKRIIRYVAGTLDHGLYYPRCPGAAHFVGYSDSDHAGDIDTSKSVLPHPCVHSNLPEVAHDGLATRVRSAQGRSSGGDGGGAGRRWWAVAGSGVEHQRERTHN